MEEVSKEVRTIEWHPKGCDICGEEEKIRTLGRRKHEAHTRSRIFIMEFEDVVCEECGFVFASNIPPNSFLYDYYADAYSSRSSYVDIDPDYDIESRVDTIQRYVPESGSIAEIGANTGYFCRELRLHGYEVIGSDPIKDKNEDVKDQFFGRGESDSVENICDAVVSYYVLEHVTDANKWLNEVTNILRDGGTIVIEVPNFEYYPEDSLNDEHLLHFSLSHLKSLLNKHGISILEADTTNPSRYFGMEVVGQLTGDEQFDPQGICGAETSVERYKRGRSKQEQERRQRSKVAGMVMDLWEEYDDARVYFWGANEYATDISNFIDGINPYIVDSSDSKIGTSHPGFSFDIRGPEFDLSVDCHRIFVLCSPSWNEQIYNQIKEVGIKDKTVLDGVEGVIMN